MHIRPFSGMLLVCPVKQSEVTKGGLFISDNARKELQAQFDVVSVGSGRVFKRKNGKHLRLAVEVKAGDRIVANSYAGKEIDCDGKRMRLIDQTSIMAIITES